MIKKFYKQRKDFDLFVSMLKTDSRLSDYEFYLHYPDVPLEMYGHQREKVEKYRKLIKKLDLMYAQEFRGGYMFEAYEIGEIGGDYYISRGYIYFEGDLEYVSVYRDFFVSDLDTLESVLLRFRKENTFYPRFMAFRKIEGNWYLYLDAMESAKSKMKREERKKMLEESSILQ